MTLKEKNIREQIAQAIAQLSKSERGQQALKDLRTLIDNGANSLDSANTEALVELLNFAVKGWYIGN